MKLKELAARTQTHIDAEIPDLDIIGAAGLDEAGRGQVSFLANPRYTQRLRTTKASAVFVAEGVGVEDHVVALRSADPYLAYTRALRIFHPEPESVPFIHPAAVIHPTAHLAENVSIGAFAVIGMEVTLAANVRIHPNVTVYDNVRIGAGSVIHSGVAIREGTRIGERVTIYNNAVIGSDGFGYAKDEERRWLKIPQTGRVVIEDDVEIGAGSTIDRASVGETRIARGVKIDNLVQVGHSCTVGEDALVCAQVGMAGSSHVGKRVVLTGQVGIGGHLTVGDDAMLYPQSGVPTDVPAGEVLCGSPAIDNHDFWRSIAVFKKLGNLPKTIRAIEKRISQLESRFDE